MIPKYMVQRKDTNARIYLADAREVSVFMWGRDLKQYSIFQLQSDLPADVGGMQRELERRDSTFWVAEDGGIALKDLPKWKAGQNSQGE